MSLLIVHSRVFNLYALFIFYISFVQGADSIHFQDFNTEVLKHLTIPNVNANLPSGSTVPDNREIRYFAGDWGEVNRILPHANIDNNDAPSPDNYPTSGYDVILMAETVYSISTLQILYNLIKKVRQWNF